MGGVREFLVQGEMSYKPSFETDYYYYFTIGSSTIFLPLIEYKAAILGGVSMGCMFPISFVSGLVAANYVYDSIVTKVYDLVVPNYGVYDIEASCPGSIEALYYLAPTAAGGAIITSLMRYAAGNCLENMQVGYKITASRGVLIMTGGYMQVSQIVFPSQGENDCSYEFKNNSTKNHYDIVSVDKSSPIFDKEQATKFAMTSFIMSVISIAGGIVSEYGCPSCSGDDGYQEFGGEVRNKAVYALLKIATGIVASVNLAELFFLHYDQPKMDASIYIIGKQLLNDTMEGHDDIS